jgi:hypothetical protein
MQWQRLPPHARDDDQVGALVDRVELRSLEGTAKVDVVADPEFLRQRIEPPAFVSRAPAGHDQRRGDAVI